MDYTDIRKALGRSSKTTGRRKLLIVVIDDEQAQLAAARQAIVGRGHVSVEFQDMASEHFADAIQNCDGIISDFNFDPMRSNLDHLLTVNTCGGLLAIMIAQQLGKPIVLCSKQGGEIGHGGSTTHWMERNTWFHLPCPIVTGFDYDSRIKNWSKAVDVLEQIVGQS